MSLLPALCGFVYAPFMKTFSSSFTPMFVCTPFMETWATCSSEVFIHTFVRGTCWLTSAPCFVGDFAEHFRPHVSSLHSYSFIQIEQSSHKSARDAHYNFRKTHGPVKTFLFITSCLWLAEECCQFSYQQSSHINLIILKFTWLINKFLHSTNHLFFLM